MSSWGTKSKGAMIVFFLSAGPGYYMSNMEESPARRRLRSLPCRGRAISQGSIQARSAGDLHMILLLLRQAYDSRLALTARLMEREHIGTNKVRLVSNGKPLSPHQGPGRQALAFCMRVE
jgi:hypothetical protein